MMLAYQNLRYPFLLLFIAFCASCRKPAAVSQTDPPVKNTQSGQKTGAEGPAWLNAKIREFAKDKPANPPVTIYSYHYKGALVYFITSRCCDIPSEVYNVEGQQLCQPDGGFTGKGDGKCPDFFQTRTDEKLIWQDLRQ